MLEISGRELWWIPRIVQNQNCSQFWNGTPRPVQDIVKPDLVQPVDFFLYLQLFERTYIKKIIFKTGNSFEQSLKSTETHVQKFELSK